MPRFALIALLLLAGCAAHRQYFQPTERLHGTTVGGYPEALYTLAGPQGQFGEAKIWSNGAYRSANESVIHVGIEIHNTSGQPIELRAADVELESVAAVVGTVAHVRPRQAKDRVFAPGSIAETGFEFTLPDEVAPGEVTGFLLRWRVHNTGHSYGQRTPFAVLYRRRAYPAGYGYPYWGCDPFDAFCSYPYGPYYGPYYGIGFSTSYYHAYPTVVVPARTAHPGVIIHPRR
jgi:hypothetical protein